MNTESLKEAIKRELPEFFAGSPPHPAETGSLSYEPVFRFRQSLPE